MVPNLPDMLQKFIDQGEKAYAIITAWILGPLCFTVFGFYFGTIAADPTHVGDLREPLIVDGLYYALGGLAIGIAVAVFVTLWYPRQVDSEPESLHQRPSEVYDSMDVSVEPDPGN